MPSEKQPSAVSRWKRWLPWAGRHFDTLPELAMHLAMWCGVFAIGVVFGAAKPTEVAKWYAIGGFAVVAIVGIPAQIAVEVHQTDAE